MTSGNEDQPLARAQSALKSLVVFIDACTLIGAFVSTFLMIFLVYQTEGILVAILLLPLLALIYIPGPAATCAIVASILYFHFHILGLWLPVLTYVLAVISYSVTPRRANSSR